MEFGSPYQTIWRLSLKHKAAAETDPIYYRVLSNGNPIHAFGFPDLHIAVLNIDSRLTFEATLALTSREAINEPDCTGRTALSWAAEIGELERIKMLLMKGADPNITDLSGKASLHWCAHNVDCMTALLDAGAEVDQQEKSYGETKLMQFIRYHKLHDDIACLDLLWKRGACVNRPQGQKRAIIHNAVQWYRPNVLKWLLGKPIDLEARSELGMTALLHFVICDIGKHPEILEIIIDSCPDYHTKDNLEEGLCHHMARFGSLDFLHVFQRRAGFAEIDVDRRSKSGFECGEKAISEGKTAMELAEWRRDCQSEWSIDCSMKLDPDPEAYFTAFKDWIGSLRAAFVAGLLKKMEVSAKASAENEERGGIGMTVNHGREASNHLQQRIPGSFPDE